MKRTKGAMCWIVFSTPRSGRKALENPGLSTLSTEFSTTFVEIQVEKVENRALRAVYFLFEGPVGCINLPHRETIKRQLWGQGSFGNIWEDMVC